MRVVFKRQKLPDQVGSWSTELLPGSHDSPNVLEYQVQLPFAAVLLVHVLCCTVHGKNHPVQATRYQTFRIRERHRKIRRRHGEDEVFLGGIYELGEALVEKRLA